MTNKTYGKWLKATKTEGGDVTDELMGIISEPGFRVVLVGNYDLPPFRWSIESPDHPGVWLNATRTKAEAIKFIKDIGWPLILKGV